MNSFSPLFFDGKETLKYQEWQVGLQASYRINIVDCSSALIPYAGIKWAGVHVDMDEASFTYQARAVTLHDLQNGRSLGYGVGITLVGCEKWDISVEGRFVDEKALHFNTQFRF